MCFLYYLRISLDGDILDIISVKEEDAARYTCEAVNPAGKVNKDFVLTVHGKVILAKKAKWSTGGWSHNQNLKPVIQ